MLSPNALERLGSAAEQRSNEQALLVETNAILAAASEPEAAFAHVLSRLRERAGLSHAAIFRLVPNSGLLECIAQSGQRESDDDIGLLINSGTLSDRMKQAGASTQVGGTSAALGLPGLDQGELAQYVVPLRRDSRLLGFLEVRSAREGGIMAVTRKLLEQFAVQAALALEAIELREKLKAAEGRFQALACSGNLGVAICTPDGKICSVNQALPRILECRADDLRGRPYSELVQPEYRPKIVGNFAQLLEDGADFVSEQAGLVSGSNQAIWCELVFSRVRGPARQPVSILVVVHDLRRQKQVEEENSRLREQLVHAQRMECIGTLAGGLAHDFNNLLSVILGFASLVRSRLSPEDPLSEPIEMIEHSAERAAELTHQLLELARHSKPEARPIRVERILDQVVRLVRRTFDPKIEVCFQVEPELPWARADAGQLEQAILNLCINARDAMPQGGRLTIKACVSACGSDDLQRPATCPPGPYVAITVKDTGIGIEPEVMKRLFDPFFTTKGPGKGSGLGLAMVRGIANTYGGFVSVKSEVGQGAEFTIHLPAVQASEKATPDTKEPQRVGNRATVLAVDDEPMVLACTEASLGRLGYRVLKAESGSRACEIYASQTAQVDCVLLDMVMPEMSGAETLRKLRAINPAVRVILSSGYMHPDEVRAAAQGENVDFIAKPYTLEALAKAIHNVLTAPDKTQVEKGLSISPLRAAG